MLAARMPSRGATCEVQHDMPTAAGTRLPPEAPEVDRIFTHV